MDGVSGRKAHPCVTDTKVKGQGDKVACVCVCVSMMDILPRFPVVSWGWEVSWEQEGGIIKEH